MSDGYKVAQLQGDRLSPFKAFYLATLGAAQALSLDDKLGNFNIGKEADFIVLDLQATPLMALRNQGGIPQNLETLGEQIFATMILGDDRTIAATYIAGECVQIEKGKGERGKGFDPKIPGDPRFRIYSN